MIDAGRRLAYGDLLPSLPEVGAAGKAHVRICAGGSRDAIGGTADIDWSPAPIAFEAYDPLRKSGGPKCRDAQHGFSMMW